MITKINNKAAAGVFALLFSLSAFLFASCEDFFEQESDNVIYADQEHLNNAVDSIYSILGIMDKMQLLADRTILLGELRGDLVDISSSAPARVRQIAEFNVDDDNIYNSPRDYYAVINNCNYFIAHADTALKDTKNERVFMKEFAAAKAFRAWAYLQLALNYGKVRYVTKPILTKQDADAESSYPLLGITALCDELISDLQPLVPAYARLYPEYGNIAGVNPHYSYFPLYILLGELNLWAGHYRDAALNYYSYISTRNGDNSAYPTGTSRAYWRNHYTVWHASGVSRLYLNSNDELITQIPISSEYDSVPNPRYNQLKKLFNSTETNGYYNQASIVPSQSLQDISAAQSYWHLVYSSNTTTPDTLQVPSNLEDYVSGDLRLYSAWTTYDNQPGANNTTVTYQTINKYFTRNVTIWRRQMVWLRLAEALNRAGYPRFAYKILEEGVNNKNIGTDVLAYYTTAADSAFINQFRFSNNDYVLTSTNENKTPTQQGIHSRGSGNAWANPDYRFPVFTTADSLDLQVDSIERMIVTEGALEFAFEGHRYYDLLRVALRRNDPAFLADRVYARRGKQNSDAMKSEIKKDLYDKSNWFLNWNGKIGFDVTE